MAFNGNNMTPIGGNARAGDNALDRNAPMGWAYQSKTDDLEAVLATGYFDTFHLYLVAGQFIYVSLQDQKVFITVQSVDHILKQVVINSETIGGGAQIPECVIPVFTDTDFGPVSDGVIKPDFNFTYELMKDIFTPHRIDLAGSNILNSVGIRSNHRFSCGLYSIGSGDHFFFNSDPGGDVGLIIQNILIADATGLSAGRGFMNFKALTQINSFIQLDACTISGFYNGTDADSIRATRSVFENLIFLLENTTRWFNSNTVVLLDAILSVSGGSFNNAPETANTAFSVSSKNPLVGSQVTLTQVAIPFNSIEAHSNLNSLSSLVINNLFSDPFSSGPSGVGVFFNDETGTVSAVADGGGGEILCTAAGHNLLDGDTVTHDVDFADVNYQGDFIVSEVIEGVSYKVVATFGATDTGTWTNKSLTQKDPKIISRGNERIGLPNSMTVSSIYSVHFPPATKVFVVNGPLDTFVPVVDSVDPQPGDYVIDVEERIRTDDESGLATYIGLIEVDVEVKYAFSFGHSTGTAQNLEFAIIHNTTVVDSSVLQVNSGVSSFISSIGTILHLAPGDTIGLVRKNRSNNNNTDVNNIQKLITSAG